MYLRKSATKNTISIYEYLQKWLTSKTTSATNQKKLPANVIKLAATYGTRVTFNGSQLRLGSTFGLLLIAL